jgi:hypothetical protein
MMQLGLSKDTLKMINNLSKEKRAKVLEIVRRHLVASYKNGCPPESLDRIYLEAVEVAELELRFPEVEPKEPRTWEPLRRYDQYVSPKAA